MNRWLIFCFALLALATGFSSAGAQPPAQQRFLAEWCDGTRTSAAEITDWSWVDKQPRLGERPLYDLGNRARWVRDVTLEPPPPASTVIEFVGGDQLPGKVVAHRAAKVLPELPVPAHLEVEPTVLVRSAQRTQPVAFAGHDRVDPADHLGAASPRSLHAVDRVLS